jgi:sec-independent protein translocase protein TatA
MGTMSPLHWLIVLIVIILLFGAKKIPELAKGLGQGIKEFKKASSEATEDANKELNKAEKIDDKKSNSEIKKEG